MDRVMTALLSYSLSAINKRIQAAYITWIIAGVERDIALTEREICEKYATSRFLRTRLINLYAERRQ